MSSNWKLKLLFRFTFIQDSVEGMLPNRHTPLQFLPVQSNQGHMCHMLCKPSSIFIYMFKHWITGVPFLTSFSHQNRVLICIIRLEMHKGNASRTDCRDTHYRMIAPSKHLYDSRYITKFSYTSILLLWSEFVLAVLSLDNTLSSSLC